MRASCLYSELRYCRNCFMIWLIYKVFRDITYCSFSTIFLHVHVEDPCATKECPFHSDCSLDKNGEAQCSCIQGCPLIYDPVCASDGQSYPNECGLKMRACAINGSLTILHRGRCSESICTLFLLIFIFDRVSISRNVLHSPSCSLSAISLSFISSSMLYRNLSALC